MNEASNKNRRKHLRFAPMGLEASYLELQAKGEQFSADLVGLIVDESHTGAKLVFVHGDAIKLAESYRLKVGPLPVMWAKVQWIRELESGIRVCGFQYVD